MKYLTIDTTTKMTALALGQDGRLVGEGFLNTGKTHSERLIPMLDQLLNAADWKPVDLDFIGAVRGPGSFTGIRIGIATAQGLAQVLNIPLVGITSLDTLAWAGKGRPEETVVILDARKNEWYYARYIWREGRECLDGPKAVTPEALTAKLKELQKPCFLLGMRLPEPENFWRNNSAARPFCCPNTSTCPEEPMQHVRFGNSGRQDALTGIFRPWNPFIFVSQKLKPIILRNKVQCSSHIGILNIL